MTTAPTEFIAEPRDTGTAVSWTAPEKHFGDPVITGYQVTATRGDQSRVYALPADQTTAELAGLSNCEEAGEPTWVPFQITTDMPDSVMQVQAGQRVYWNHYEMRTTGDTSVTLTLYDLDLDATPVTRTVLDTQTYTPSAGFGITITESLGDGRFFCLFEDNDKGQRARIVDITSGTISIGPEQSFPALPVRVTGYEGLAVNATTAVVTATAPGPAYDGYWWEYTISGTTVTRGTPVVDDSGGLGSGLLWFRTPIIAMPDTWVPHQVISDSGYNLSGVLQKLTVHVANGTQTGEVTLGTYGDVRVSANVRTNNGHGGVDLAGRVVVATWYKLDGETRASMVVRMYSVSATLTEVAHIDIVPEFTDPDRVWMDLYHFANLGGTSQFLLVATYDWMASEAQTNIVKIVDTVAMSVIDIPAPPTQGGGLDNEPWLSMVINEDAFLLTYGSSLDIYEEWIYVRREV